MCFDLTMSYSLLQWDSTLVPDEISSPLRTRLHWLKVKCRFDCKIFLFLNHHTILHLFVPRMCILAPSAPLISYVSLFHSSSFRLNMTKLFPLLLMMWNSLMSDLPLLFRIIPISTAFLWGSPQRNMFRMLIWHVFLHWMPFLARPF